MRISELTLIAGVLLVMAQSPGLAQIDVFAGTWKVNIAQSKYEPSAAPKNETLRFEPVGDGFKVSLDGVNQQGPYHSEAVGKFDGVDVPVVATPARRAAFTYAFRRLDERTWEIAIKVNGTQQLTVRNVVSEDGRTMRGVSTVTTGGHVNQVVLYEKE